MSTVNPLPSRYPPIREEWLDRRPEPILDPERVIIDPHHHLWDHPGNRYLLPEFLADVQSGHRIAATIFVESGAMYRTDGPEALRPVGEVEFAAGTAVRASQIGASSEICAAIVGHPDLRLGHAVQDVLEAMIDAAQGRLRGVRNTTAWDSDPDVRPISNPPPGLLRDDRVHAAISRLTSLRLSLDVWVYHTQLGEVRDLARKFPNLTIVVDHVGGALGIGPYSERKPEVFETWKVAIIELALERNIYLKFGGRGMRITGAKFHENALPPSSSELATAWKPYFATCMEAFGPWRCMFESNFPVDKSMFSYPVLWNAFKRLAEGFSESEKDALFYGTASLVYDLTEKWQSPAEAPQVGDR